MKVQQVSLVQGKTHMLAWVDASLKLRAGMRVTGKDKQEWIVAVVYNSTREQDDLSYGWKVGGI